MNTIQSQQIRDELNQLLKEIYPYLIERFAEYEIGEYDPMKPHKINFPFTISFFDISFYDEYREFLEKYSSHFSELGDIITSTGCIRFFEPKDLELTDFNFFEVQYFFNKKRLNPWDGTIFWDEEPDEEKIVKVNLSEYLEDDTKDLLKIFKCIKVALISRGFIDK